MVDSRTPSGAARLLPLALAAALGLSACTGANEQAATSAAPTSSAAVTGSASASDSPSASSSAASPASSSTPAAPKSGMNGVDPAAEITPAFPEGTPVKQGKPAQVKDTSGIEGVLAWDTASYPAPGQANAGTLTHEHVTTPVEYAVKPAVGGPHAPVWMNAGVYTKPIPTERAVHLMEHGAVWITYNASLPAQQVEALRAFFKKQDYPAGVPDTPGGGNRWMVMSPWEDDSLPSPIVISAWGHQLRVEDPADPRLQSFVDEFRANPKYSPESAAVDRVPTGTGGNPAMYGSEAVNPPGTLSPDAGM
ncbi:DUF3105 domain-containing protein [Galactobacter valiniphilus]|uniref:DUF3105 domain-containing protein n=1 Tax=Galactobacter valiniphilus TaxID=2676122 RepID=UPI0037362A7D